MEKLVEIIDTRATDSWGAVWDEMETARDFIQNFYDANKVEDIEIKISDKAVHITAPVEFDYKALIYLYSNKSNDSDSVGQYGEGFKVSVLNALRNWNCKVEFYVSNYKLRYYFRNIDIASGEARTIMCELSEIDATHGSCLVISNCTNRLIEEFKFGLKHFYYINNPLFGEKLLEENYHGIIIYKSTEKHNGYVFYKKLMRKIIELPIVIVSNNPIRYVENKIKHDRDRKAFNDEVLELCLKHIFNKFHVYELKEVLYAIENFWVKGHPIINLMATSQKSRWAIDYNIFPEKYYALEQHPRGGEIFMDSLTREIVEEYKKLNYQCCPRYFSYMGMKTPDQEAKKRLQKSFNTISKTYSRDMTLLETEGIAVLANFIKELSPDLFTKFETAKYTIGENDEIVGELKKQRNYNQQHIFLNKIFFTMSFNDALSILLHEWAHIYGYDGSRSFSDALTYFISLILKNTEVITRLKEYENKWDEITVKVKQERENINDNLNANDIIKTLSKEQLVKIINSIPQEEIYKILYKYKFI